MLSDSKTGSDTNIPIRLFLRIFQWNFSSNFPFAFPSTIIIFSSGGLEKREALPRDVSPFWPEIRSIHGGCGNRKPGREREREISFDSRHVEEIYSRIAYADRCAHLRSSFSGAVSSKCSTFASTSVFSKTCQWPVSNYVRYWRGWKFHPKCLQGMKFRKEGIFASSLCRILITGRISNK